MCIQLPCGNVRFACFGCCLNVWNVISKYFWRILKFSLLKVCHHSFSNSVCESRAFEDFIQAPVAICVPSLQADFHFLYVQKRKLTVELNETISETATPTNYELET